MPQAAFLRGVCPPPLILGFFTAAAAVVAVIVAVGARPRSSPRTVQSCASERVMLRLFIENNWLLGTPAWLAHPLDARYQPDTSRSQMVF